MDAVDVTRVLPGRTRARLRRVLLGDGAPLSARAHAALLLAAVLLGASLSAAVFVGVWRDTAVRGDRAQAAQAETRKQAAAAQAQLAAAERTLATTRAALAKARKAQRTLAAQAHRSATAAAAATKRVDAAGTRAAALARSSSTLASELKALEAYVQGTPLSGIDPGFLATQIDYMLRGAQELSRAARAASP
ncbi:MAG TPA: hypothetical protein VLN26_08615 [Gaiellaceae bacterium]|nr:hypothetical protein [Gaiellaceae bacterium]